MFSMSYGGLEDSLRQLRQYEAVPWLQNAPNSNAMGMVEAWGMALSDELLGKGSDLNAAQVSAIVRPYMAQAKKASSEPKLIALFFGIRDKAKQLGATKTSDAIRNHVALRYHKEHEKKGTWTGAKKQAVRPIFNVLAAMSLAKAFL